MNSSFFEIKRWGARCRCEPTSEGLPVLIETFCVVILSLEVWLEDASFLAENVRSEVQILAQLCDHVTFLLLETTIESLRTREKDENQWATLRHCDFLKHFSMSGQIFSS